MARLGQNDHVDIIQNQWGSGTQAVEARVSIFDGRVRVRGVQSAQWRERLIAMGLPPQAPDFYATPEEFVLRLHERLGNDYFYATAPHDRNTCRFARHRVLPMVEPTTIVTSSTPMQQGA
jgi:hypothetical protein